MNTMTHSRSTWSGQTTFVLAAAGAAIGLGNIWKFPYMVGDNGGSAFVLVYIICVLLIGIPVMAAEILIGRRARQNPIGAYETLAIKSNCSRKWRFMGCWGLIGLMLTLSFYSVVSGWAVYYLFKTLSGTLIGLDSTHVVNIWQNFLANPLYLIGYHTLFLFLTLFVVSKGVQRGLERSSIIMMPLLFFVLFILIVYAFVENSVAFNHAFHFLFNFNFHKITGAVIINAMGHAFFTLAIGVGGMAIYGSYVPKTVSIGKSISIIVILDVLVAFLSGLAIFSIVFAYHLSPQAGPGLIFVTLPIAYAHMKFGIWIGSLFFTLLIFAAWTSSINMAEPLIATLTEKFSLNRQQGCWLIGILVWTLGLLSVFSFNYWENVKLFGQFNLFTLITDLVTNVIFPVGGIAYAIFSGWFLPKKMTKNELALKNPNLYKTWRFLIRYISPMGILFIFCGAIFHSL